MPKKFTFSLENILKYRKNLQNNKMIKLHNTKILLETEKEKLSEIETLKSQTLKSGKIENPQKINLLNRQIFHEYVDQINDNISQQNLTINNSRKKVIEATEELNDETKRKKILEKLKEKHLDEFKIDIRRKEEKDNSELALRKSFFNNN